MNKLHQSDFLGKIFHTLNYCLQKELNDCQTVLDLGCGPSSPIQFCQHIKYSIGVEAFKPYLTVSKKKKIHNKYLNKKIENLNFEENSFDAVILIEVLEHLSKKQGRSILKKAAKWAKKKVVLSTPNGYFQMGDVDKNPWQKHLSGWTTEELSNLGFKCHGLAGAKIFYKKENNIESLVNDQKHSPIFYENIRFKPQRFFYFINALVQIVTYYFPKVSFGLLAVKNKR